MPRQAIDLTGKVFGRLIVVKRAENNNREMVCWECVCSCGEKIIVPATYLVSGKRKSCDCLRKENGADNGRKTALSRTKHGMREERLYHCWKNMHSRCDNGNRKDSKSYKDRGITYCDEWKEFMPFMEWALKNGYRDDLTLDRINVDGNYEPSNCRWATRYEQTHNRRPLQ